MEEPSAFLFLESEKRKSSARVSSFAASPDVERQVEVLGVEVAEEDAGEHLGHPEQNGHLHLERVEERQLRAAAVPRGVHAEGVCGARLDQPGRGLIAV